jgi:hypothetical protein
MINLVNDLASAMKEAAEEGLKQLVDEMGVENIVDKLNKLPIKIEGHEMQLTRNRRALEEAKGNLELARQNVVAEVAEEKNGNDKPKYSNETARNAEVAKRLVDDTNYLEAKEAYKAAEDALNAAQFELNRLNNEFGACKIIGQLLTAKMQVLAGL